MVRQAGIVFAMVCSLGLAGCGDDSSSPVDDNLPQAPQIFPSATSGVLGYALTLQGESETLDAVFVNGGKDNLVISSVTLENLTANVFVMTQPDAAALTVKSKKAIGIPIKFTSPGRGVFLGDLVVKSNAANLPEIRLQLVAPGAGDRVPDVADIELFESSVTIANVAGLNVPAALVRLYNLGGASLDLNGYSIADANFAFLSGTAVPGADCTPTGQCVPSEGSAAGCCGGLTCEVEANAQAGLCQSINVPRGRFVTFGVTWAIGAPLGAHEGDILITSNDPDSSVVTVHVTGTF